MRVPQSSYYHQTCTCSEENCSIHINDLFLSADERYEIFEVKSAERPHLLYYNDENSDTSNDSDSSDSASTSTPPPLVDGCDILGWRKEKMMACTPFVQSALNIGQSSTMFRRDSQLISHSSRRDCSWKIIKEKLSHRGNIRKVADIIQHEDYKQLVPLASKGSKRTATRFAVEYEQRNIPAIILGATAGWKCMPQVSTNGDLNVTTTLFNGGCNGGWTFENLLLRFAHVNMRFSDTHGEMMSFATYAKYITNLEGIHDDSPLGIYDSEFGDEDSPTSILVEEYEVPSCFSPDLFALADSDPTEKDNSSRPPYRWILIGPERSGTGKYFLYHSRNGIFYKMRLVIFHQLFVFRIYL